MRTIEGMEHYLQPLDDAINQTLLPAILGGSFSPSESDVFSLAIKHGGLGIPIFTEIAGECYRSLREMTSSFIAVMVLQNEELTNYDVMLKTKADVIKRVAME